MLVRRRRPLVRAAVVGGAAYSIGKNRARAEEEQRQAEEEQAEKNERYEEHMAEEQSAGSKGGSSSSGMEKITQLQKLHESGALTDEEFAKAKEKILSEL